MLCSFQLKPNAAPPDYGIQNDEVTLWISREYHIPMKVSATFIQNDKDGKSQAMDMTILVQRFHPNPRLPLSTWTFVPPPDSQPESANPPQPRSSFVRGLASLLEWFCLREHSTQAVQIPWRLEP